MYEHATWWDVVKKKQPLESMLEASLPKQLFILLAKEGPKWGKLLIPICCISPPSNVFFVWVSMTVGVHVMSWLENRTNVNFFYFLHLLHKVKVKMWQYKELINILKLACIHAFPMWVYWFCLCKGDSTSTLLPKSSSLCLLDLTCLHYPLNFQEKVLLFSSL